MPKPRSLGTFDVHLAELSHSASSGNAVLKLTLANGTAAPVRVGLRVDRSTAPYLFDRLASYLAKEQEAVRSLRAGLALPPEASPR